MPKNFGAKPQRLAEIPYTPRDVELVYAIFVKKYITTPQIWRLFFQHTKHQKVCQQRLRKLCQYGLVRAIEQAVRRGEGRRPYIFTLDKLGGDLLVLERGVDPALIDTTPRVNEHLNPFIQHLLSTTDFHIALQAACAATGVILEEWLEERELRSQPSPVVTILSPQGKAIHVGVIPDGQFVLNRNEKRGLFYLEVDRTTVDIAPSSFEKRSISRKVRAYLALEQTDEYRQAHGNRPFRVLTVAVGQQRMLNMRKATENILKQTTACTDDMSGQEKEQKEAEYTRLASRFLFTTLDQVTTNNILTQPIWYVVGSDKRRSLIDD